MLAVTQDGFLGGRLQISQPDPGYRAGIDPVLLAAACPAQPGEDILELGCGVGVASLCLGARVQKLTLHGVEILPEYVNLARINATQNNLEFEVQTGDVSARPMAFYDQQFHQVIMNPPYFSSSSSTASPDPGRALGRTERVDLEAWVDMASRRLRSRGYVTIIQRVERLPDILRSLNGKLGSIVVQPLSPREGRAPHLILVRARKSGRAAFKLCAVKVLHAGHQHITDKPDYSNEIFEILRNGAAFEWGA